MTHKTLIHSLTAAAILSATFSISEPTIANASSHFTPPGLDLTPCVIPSGFGPKLPPIGGGGIIMPPPPPGPGGGGGSGGFGGGLGAEICLGIGLGIVNSLNRPRRVIVQQPTYVQPVQSGLHRHDQFCLGKYKSYNINTMQYHAIPVL